jgi:ATP-binding cassette, subfamily F, member 3
MDIIEEVLTDPSVVFIFPNPEIISPPILRLDEVTLGYENHKVILDHVNIDVNQESRFALVGPNGAGKSTLIKALLGKEVEVLEGNYFMHNRLRVGIFNQHHVEQLDLTLTALEQIMTNYPGEHHEKYRQHLGSFGISGQMATKP